VVTINNKAAASSIKSAAAQAAAHHSGPLGYMAGMLACSLSGLSSAYAGVYFEKYVKGKHAASLWVRNIQLGMFGVPASFIYAMIKDSNRIFGTTVVDTGAGGGITSVSGPFQGFDLITWSTVALQVFGGLVTGMVVKYCDNILKNFALAVSVILTVLLAVPLFGQWPSMFFLVGVGLVLLSVFMYGQVVGVEACRKVFLRLEGVMGKGVIRRMVGVERQ